MHSSVHLFPNPELLEGGVSCFKCDLIVPGLVTLRHCGMRIPGCDSQEYGKCITCQVTLSLNL